MFDPDAILPFIAKDEALADYVSFVADTPIELLVQALGNIEAQALDCNLSDAGADRAAQLAIDALAQGRPFSMVRIGDGEGNILSAFDLGFERARIFSTRRILYAMFATPDFPVREIQMMHEGMVQAVLTADVLGVSDHARVDRLRILRREPAENQDVRGYMGSYESILQVASLVQSHKLIPPLVVTNHAQRYMLPHLPDVIAAARQITLVSPYDLRDAFARRFNRHDLRVHLIPNQDSNARGQGAKWYPTRYQEIIKDLEIAPGGLFLIAAGLAGKDLCRSVKLGGGVAIDIGSAVDVWCGVPVRGYHSAEFVERHRLFPTIAGSGG